MTQFHFKELDEERHAVYLCRNKEKCTQESHANMIAVGWINEDEMGFVFTPKVSKPEDMIHFEAQKKIKYCVWDVWDFVRNRKQLAGHLT